MDALWFTFNMIWCCCFAGDSQGVYMVPGKNTRASWEKYLMDELDPPGLVVKAVNEIVGKGVFADRKFRAGSFLMEYHGQLISYEEAVNRETSYPEEYGSFMLFFQHGRKVLCVDATFSSQIGRYVNDGIGYSKNAELKVVCTGTKPHVVLFASRNISKNEEIRFDYGVKDLPWRNNKKNIKRYASLKPLIKECYVMLEDCNSGAGRTVFEKEDGTSVEIALSDTKQLFSISETRKHSDDKYKMLSSSASYDFVATKIRTSSCETCTSTCNINECNCVGLSQKDLYSATYKGISNNDGLKTDRKVNNNRNLLSEDNAEMQNTSTETRGQQPASQDFVTTDIRTSSCETCTSNFNECNCVGLSQKDIYSATCKGISNNGDLKTDRRVNNNRKSFSEDNAEMQNTSTKTRGKQPASQDFVATKIRTSSCETCTSNINECNCVGLSQKDLYSATYKEITNNGGLKTDSRANDNRKSFSEDNAEMQNTSTKTRGQQPASQETDIDRQYLWGDQSTSCAHVEKETNYDLVSREDIYAASVQTCQNLEAGKDVVENIIDSTSASFVNFSKEHQYEASPSENIILEGSALKDGIQNQIFDRNEHSDTRGIIVHYVVVENSDPDNAAEENNHIILSKNDIEEREDPEVQSNSDNVEMGKNHYVESIESPVECTQDVLLNQTSSNPQSRKKPHRPCPYCHSLKSALTKHLIKNMEMKLK